MVKKQNFVKGSYRKGVEIWMPRYGLMKYGCRISEGEYIEYLYKNLNKLTLILMKYFLQKI